MCDDVGVILFSSAILIFSTTLVLKLFCFMIHIEFIFVEMKLCDLPFTFLFVFLYTFCFFFNLFWLMRGVCASFAVNHANFFNELVF